MVTIFNRKIVRCDCGLVSVFPQPSLDELNDYYQNIYNYTSYDIKDIKLFIPEVRKLEQYLKGNSRKLLEIGCAYGNFLAAAKSCGWETKGVEKNKNLARSAIDRFDLDVFCGMIEDASFDKESFSAVYMSHILEHLSNPYKTLKLVYDLLIPGGLIFLKVPNFESLAAKLAGRYWEWLDPIGHLIYFSVDTLSTFVEKAGFHIISLETSKDNPETIYRLFYPHEWVNKNKIVDHILKTGARLLNRKAMKENAGVEIILIGEKKV